MLVRYEHIILQTVIPNNPVLRSIVTKSGSYQANQKRITISRTLCISIFVCVPRLLFMITKTSSI